MPIGLARRPWFPYPDSPCIVVVELEGRNAPFTVDILQQLEHASAGDPVTTLGDTVIVTETGIGIATEHPRDLTVL